MHAGGLREARLRGQAGRRSGGQAGGHRLGSPLTPQPLFGKKTLGAKLRAWLFAGLLVWLPLGATLLVIRLMVELLDVSLLLIPQPLRPDIPGLGVVLSIVLVLGTGVVAANYLGGRMLGWMERWLARIPLVRSLYGGMKKIAEAMFSTGSTAFKRALMVEFPRKGMWSIGFITGDPIDEMQRKVEAELLTIYIPTTPNPTNGFVVLVDKSEVIWLDMSVEEAMSLIISLGVVTPAPKTLGQP